jgi:hypothetical protein
VQQTLGLMLALPASLPEAFWAFGQLDENLTQLDDEVIELLRDFPPAARFR